MAQATKFQLFKDWFNSIPAGTEYGTAEVINFIKKNNDAMIRNIDSNYDRCGCSPNWKAFDSCAQEFVYYTIAFYHRLMRYNGLMESDGRGHYKKLANCPANATIAKLKDVIYKAA